MNIVTALDAIVTLQEGLTITSPVSLGIKRVYKYPPDASKGLTDTPAWLNSWSLTRTDQQYSTVLHHYYTVRMQLAVLDASENRAAAIASAFFVALVSAWTADTTLDSTVHRALLRGGDPTLVAMEWAGKRHIGLDLYLDLEMYAP